MSMTDEVRELIHVELIKDLRSNDNLRRYFYEHIMPRLGGDPAIGEADVRQVIDVELKAVATLIEQLGAPKS